jgi:hypothetical protein
MSYTREKEHHAIKIESAKPAPNPMKATAF